MRDLSKLTPNSVTIAALMEAEAMTFKVGERVHHVGRKEDGTITSVANGVVCVEFDNPTPRGNVSRGEFDEVWFNTYPGWLSRCPETKK